MATSHNLVMTSKAKYSASHATWNIIMVTHASKQELVMLESRMQGQLACPVWRALGRNDSQQWENRAPLLPYITRLKGPQKWTYFYLYVMLDIFSRYVVGWLIAGSESAALAKELLATACLQQGIVRDQLTIHADRGGPMTAKAVAHLLSDLGVTKTHTRPYTSNDNPFSEAHFKTVKYRPDFPHRFGSLQVARAWARPFFDWYNHQHWHNG